MQGVTDIIGSGVTISQQLLPGQALPGGGGGGGGVIDVATPLTEMEANDGRTLHGFIVTSFLSKCLEKNIPFFLITLF